jgi:hypothetical protein
MENSEELSRFTEVHPELGYNIFWKIMIKSPEYGKQMRYIYIIHFKLPMPSTPCPFCNKTNKNLHTQAPLPKEYACVILRLSGGDLLEVIKCKTFMAFGSNLWLLGEWWCSAWSNICLYGGHYTIALRHHWPQKAKDSIPRPWTIPTLTPKKADSNPHMHYTTIDPKSQRL